MSWTKEQREKKPFEWKIPRDKADEHAAETSAVEDLSMLPQDILILPQDIQTGGDNWAKQQINFSSEWTDDDIPAFYPQKFRWIGSGFYSKNYLNVWTASFYAVPAGWGSQVFYPRNYLDVWQPFSNGPKREPEFYPQSFKWVASFYMIQDEWNKQEFYPENINGVWATPFYLVLGGWYMSDTDLDSTQLTFPPFGL